MAMSNSELLVYQKVPPKISRNFSTENRSALHDAIGGHGHVARAEDHVILREVQDRDALPRQALHHVTLLETWEAS